MCSPSDRVYDRNLHDHVHSIHSAGPGTGGGRCAESTSLGVLGHSLVVPHSLNLSVNLQVDTLALVIVGHKLNDNHQIDSN